MITYTPPSIAKSIPVIDLTGSFSETPEDRKAVAWEVHKACRNTGFFYISNHGVAEALRERQFEVARRFFALPLEEKMRIDARNSSCWRGYEAMSIQTLDDGSRPDFKESFMSGRECGANHPYVIQGVPYYGANQWPEAYPEMQAYTEEYIAAMQKLGTHLLGILALSLEMPEDYFTEALKEPAVATRLLRYPPQSSVGDGNEIGAGAHTDWGMITILMQDDVGGLEVRNAAGDWIRAPHIPGTFVINLGDMVPILTNGLYNSNYHRVLNSVSGRERYSVPTFFDPDYTYRMKPVPTCVGPEGPAFDEITLGDHISAMYSKTYGTPREASAA